jgi:hypothetical protein
MTQEIKVDRFFFLLYHYIWHACVRGCDEESRQA